MVGASAAPGCGGQSSGGPGGRLQVEEWASQCFAWEMDSPLKRSAWTKATQPRVLPGKWRLSIPDVAVLPCVCRGSGQGSPSVLSVCIGSCVLGVAGRPL